MTRGTIILSLDCEGKWGMADHLSPHHAAVITNRNLAQVYAGLLKVLERRRLRATFAFVGAWTMNRDEYQPNADLFGDSPESHVWPRNFRADLQRGVTDGWFAPELLRTVVADGRHEIAS
ncbi:MAG: polysaccharide deacetylase family protein [Candidatus Solibacter usitatus]|nr:polysaccharide deacetylase family protein [Candidatus Solibacter usitatus]